MLFPTIRKHRHINIRTMIHTPSECKNKSPDLTQAATEPASPCRRADAPPYQLNRIPELHVQPS